MKKIITYILVLPVLFLLIINYVWAQAPSDIADDANNKITQETFKAIVTEVTPVKEAPGTDGEGTVKVRDVKLIGISAKFKNQKIEVSQISTPDELVKTDYQVGDKVLVMLSYDENGVGVYAITDHVRTDVIIWLSVIFVLAVIAVGRFKGVRSILSLIVTFFIMIKYIVPQILDGADPVIVTVIGSIAILISIIYLTEGFNMKSHIASTSIMVSLLFVIALSWFLVGIAKLSGLSSEEAGFIVTLGTQTLNLQGILLAGIIIGTLGALDDVVISQVVTVAEITSADPYQTRTQILKKAFNVGVSHISAMTNTLFLAYSGAALPLLILFVSGQSSFGSWDVAMNNEMVATEIIRTLAGTLGIVLSVPIATFISVWWLKRK